MGLQRHAEHRPARSNPLARLLALLGALGALGVLGGCGGGAPEPARAVVLVVVDTLRADHLGAYGYEKRDATPEIDRLAASGRVFERAWSTSPWTLPSFGSMYTGLLPSRHRAGVVAGVVDGRRGFEKLGARAVTVAEALRDGGFATAAIVNNPFLASDFGVDRGFDDYDHEGGGNLKLRRADVVVDRALEWLDAHGSERFFLVVHLFDPHMDYDPHESVRGTFTGAMPGNLALPISNLRALRANASRLGEDDREFIRAAYDEELLFVDRQVGRLFAGLERHGVLRDGLVLFTSDHGEELFDHGGFEHGHAMGEELLHVPLIAWGGAVAPGRTPTPVSTADVARTLLEATGVPVPEPSAESLGIGGRSLWPHLAAGDALEDEPLVAEGLLYGPPELEALRVGRWKLVRAPGEDAGPRTTLYDLVADPGERSNRAADEPARVAELARELNLRLAAARHGVVGEEADVSDEMRSKLKDLGYTE